MAFFCVNALSVAWGRSAHYSFVMIGYSDRTEFAVAENQKISANEAISIVQIVAKTQSSFL